VFKPINKGAIAYLVSFLTFLVVACGVNYNNTLEELEKLRKENDKNLLTIEILKDKVNKTNKG
jgi:hypothetical protein